MLKKFWRKDKKIYFCGLKLKGGVSCMIIVPIKEGENLERALKKFKRKFEKTGIVRELRSRQAFTKKSVIQRESKKRAIYRQQLQLKEE